MKQAHSVRLIPAGRIEGSIDWCAGKYRRKAYFGRADGAAGERRREADVVYALSGSSANGRAEQDVGAAVFLLVGVDAVAR